MGVSGATSTNGRSGLTLTRRASIKVPFFELRMTVEIMFVNRSRCSREGKNNANQLEMHRQRIQDRCGSSYLADGIDLAWQGHCFATEAIRAVDPDVCTAQRCSSATGAPFARCRVDQRHGDQEESGVPSSSHCPDLTAQILLASAQ